MNIIDLSHILEAETPVYPGTPPPRFEVGCTVEKDGFKETSLNMFSHTGTHTDCPAHIFENGADTRTLPVDSFFGKALKIDCTNLPPGKKIDLPLLQSYNLPQRLADFIIFQTGWDKYWKKDPYFSGFPVLDAEAAHFLVKTGIKGIGVDAISVDKVEDEHLPIHHILLGHSLIIVENLTGLSKVPDDKFLFSCLPLKLKDGDGSPCRAVAIVL